MLIWMCALHCEAKPLIDFYRLKKVTEKLPFDLYKNNDIVCIVSGMGMEKMSEATLWAIKLFSDQLSTYWINLGIAGHKDLTVGTVRLVNQVRQSDHSETIDLEVPFNSLIRDLPAISLVGEQTNYDDIALFDMEVYSFIKSVTQVTPVNQCQSLKIISDNQNSPPIRNKAKISQLIADNINTIIEFASQLNKTEDVSQ